ncbi:hypothetical protein QYM41_01360 [Kocuria sp. CPCC 205268]|uniref:hypothetical protein n=1 Tax=Kocuria oxytropis TaxID=3058913 RepID=UPI0034D6B645
MTTTTTERTWSRPIVSAALALAVLATAGCAGTQTSGPAAESSTESSTGTAGATAPRTPGTADTAVDLAYDGPYDEAFRAGLSDYAGEQVRLRGEVSDLIGSRSAYVITAPGAPGTDPLLVSARYAAPELEEGAVVEVTGTLREDFEPPVTEEAGGDEDEQGFYAEHAGEPYLDEATVEGAS